MQEETGNIFKGREAPWQGVGWNAVQERLYTGDRCRKRGDAACPAEMEGKNDKI